MTPAPIIPEAPARLVTAVAALGDIPDRDAIVRLPPRLASPAELARVHDPGYLEALADLCAAGGGSLDPDTPVSPGSWETALMTAGAGLAAVDALRANDGAAAMVLGRPPGHHATRDTGMGFCLVNNVAVAAAALAAAGERVAVIDWDVHHGNGTQDIFWADPSVLYVSVHQWPLYPGTGRPDERGGGPAWGTNLNLPLPPGATGDVYLALFDEVVTPSVERFGATWVLISAGFDAHRDDPLANMGLTAGDFADLDGAGGEPAWTPGPPGPLPWRVATTCRRCGRRWRPACGSVGGRQLPARGGVVGRLGPDPGGHLPDAVAWTDGKVRPDQLLFLTGSCFARVAGAGAGGPARSRTLREGRGGCRPPVHQHGRWHLVGGQIQAARLASSSA